MLIELHLHGFHHGAMSLPGNWGRCSERFALQAAVLFFQLAYSPASA